MQLQPYKSHIGQLCSTRGVQSPASKSSWLEHARLLQSAPPPLQVRLHLLQPVHLLQAPYVRIPVPDLRQDARPPRGPVQAPARAGPVQLRRMLVRLHAHACKPWGDVAQTPPHACRLCSTHLHQAWNWRMSLPHQCVRQDVVGHDAEGAAPASMVPATRAGLSPAPRHALG